MMKIAAIIPARGGSKGIPRKNLLVLGGMPLVSRVVATALKVPEIDRVLVSTDDPEIAQAARAAGAQVPFLRPKELSGDAVPTLPVLRHAVQYLESAGFRPDFVVLLYPTSPLITPDRIAEGIRKITREGCDSLIAVVEDTGHFWRDAGKGPVRLYPRDVKNRQLTRPLFRENGALYISSRDLLMEKGQITGGKIGILTMDRRESVDIDEPLDLEIARMLLEGDGQ